MRGYKLIKDNAVLTVFTSNTRSAKPTVPHPVNTMNYKLI